MTINLTTPRPVTNVTYLFEVDNKEIMPRLQGNKDFSFQIGQKISNSLDLHTDYWVKGISTLCVYHKGDDDFTLMIRLELRKNELQNG